MKRLRKRVGCNVNTLEQYVSRFECSCYCGPGGYPWATAQNSTAGAWN